MTTTTWKTEVAAFGGGTMLRNPRTGRFAMVARTAEDAAEWARKVANAPTTPTAPAGYRWHDGRLYRVTVLPEAERRTRPQPVRCKRGKRRPAIGVNGARDRWHAEARRTYAWACERAGVAA